MKRIIHLFFLVAVFFSASPTFGQDRNGDLDSLRKREEEGADTLIYTSKFVRYTTLNLLKDSTVTFPIDTSLRNFQLYSPLYQVHRPTINLGSTGLASREL
ncbi:MAG TPA: hypothetical protein VGD90_08245, partial [Sphingobacteriaceae bacterium]